MRATCFISICIVNINQQCTKNTQQTWENKFLKNSQKQDPKLTYFTQSYSTLLEELELMKNNLVEDVNGNLIEWRDNYDWFTSFFEGNNDDDYINYRLDNPKYKNKVTYHYALVYNNYLPVLEKFKDLFKEFENVK